MSTGNECGMTAGACGACCSAAGMKWVWTGLYGCCLMVGVVLLKGGRTGEETVEVVGLFLICGNPGSGEAVASGVGRCGDRRPVARGAGESSCNCVLCLRFRRLGDTV